MKNRDQELLKRVLEMRMRGMVFREIAKEIGVHPAYARDLYLDAIVLKKAGRLRREVLAEARVEMDLQSGGVA